MPAMLIHQSYLAMPQRPKLQPLFTDFTSIERSMLSNQIASDTDFEDDGSSIDEYEYYSPSYPDRRISQSTVSTIDEAPTPQSIHKAYFDAPLIRKPSVQGPTGPHLFRASIGSQANIEASLALQLSPLFSKTMTLSPMRLNTPKSSIRTTGNESSGNYVRTWSSRQVAWWMLGLGFEDSIVDKFVSQEIDGPVLLDLQFPDLKALDISSLTTRQRIWTELEALRRQPVSVRVPPESPVKRPASARASSGLEKSQQVRRNHDNIVSPVTSTATSKRRGRMNHAKLDVSVTPAESVSIVAIEQLIPKAHVCKKGQNCIRWQRQQRLVEQINKEHGCNITLGDEEQIFISGFPGNARDAERILKDVVQHTVQTTTPSTPQSVRLPARTSYHALQEEVLLQVQELTPQDNVRQYLRNSQPETPVESPLAYDEFPHFEMFPTPPLPPLSPSKIVYRPDIPSFPKPQLSRSASAQPFVTSSPHLLRSASAQPLMASSPQQQRQQYTWLPQQNPSTPIKQIAPTTGPPRDLIPRQISASAPPTVLNYASQASPQRILHSASSTTHIRRRPSLALPTLHETPIHIPASPLTPAQPKPSEIYGSGTTHAGWVKHLRRTPRAIPLLKAKESWTDGHVRLNGTLLSVHGSADASGASEIARVDVKDFAIACRSASFGDDDDDDSPSCGAGGATAKKFAAALKALRGGASPKREACAGAPYTFHLVPCVGAATATSGVRGALSLGEARARRHHFAVGSAEERVDWMREVMLAKAIRQKLEGFDVVVDGVRM